MSVAKYTVSADEQSRFQIEFESGAKNVVGLRMAPDQIESVLQSGRWLILVFAVWDAKDRPTIDIACEVAATTENFQVAVRPFEFGDEFASWAPQFSSNAGALSVTESDGDVKITTRTDDHPVWFVMREGQITAALVGAREKTDVEEFIRLNLS